MLTRFNDWSAVCAGWSNCVPNHRAQSGKTCSLPCPNHSISPKSAFGNSHACLKAMKNRFLVILFSALLALSASCERTAKDDIKDAGGDLKDAAKATGRAADKVIDKAADKVKEGADKVKDKTKP
jgi:hypothetical protein